MKGVIVVFTGHFSSSLTWNLERFRKTAMAVIYMILGYFIRSNSLKPIFLPGSDYSVNPFRGQLDHLVHSPLPGPVIHGSRSNNHSEDQ